MKHYFKILALGLVLAMLAACAPAATQPSGSATGSASSAGQTQPDKSGAVQTGDVSQPEGPEDFSGLVFDTTQDAGKLTVRYLYLTQDYKPEGSEGVTTGDSAVYTSPDGKVMLVDCGNALGGQEVVEQLKRMGVEKIDIFVCSHPHADHIGGYKAVMEAFPIGQIYVNGHEYDSGTYRGMMAKIQELNIPCQVLKAGDEFMFGAQVQVKVYSPFEGDMDEVAGGYLDANNGSIAMRMTYGQSSFWTSGDLYIPAEQKLVETYGDEIQSDVAKLNHHGKDTSNCKDYVTTLGAKVAVGMFNSVSSKTVVLRYQAAGAQVFYNCADGAIRVSTTGDGTYDVQTQLLRDIPSLPDPVPDGHYEIK